jgi:hypothetical protein
MKPIRQKFALAAGFAVLCAAVVLIVALRYSREEAARIEILKSGGLVEDEFRGPRWLVDLTEKRFPNICSSIVAVDFEDKRVADRDLRCLALLPRLERLYLAETRVTGAGLAGVRVASLLDLSHTDVDDTALRYVRGMPLESLYLTGTSVTDAGVAQLRGLTSLRRLSLSRTRVTKRCLESLAGMKGLRELYLDGVPFEDADLVRIAKFKALRTLHIRGSRMTGAGLKTLSALPDLEELAVSGAPLDDAALTHLPALSKLKVVFLDGCPFTIAGLEHIGKLPDLVWVSLLRIDGTDRVVYCWQWMWLLESDYSPKMAHAIREVWNFYQNQRRRGEPFGSVSIIDPAKRRPGQRLRERDRIPPKKPDAWT